MGSEDTYTVAIIGAGAAGLMAADRLSVLRPDISITLFDAMPSPARKVLMAGKSGLNITHQSGIDAPEAFCSQYGPASKWIAPMLSEFGPKQIVGWMEDLGQESFAGSSGRIFPKTMKASPLLRALMQRLASRNVALETRHRWHGWEGNGALLFSTPQGERCVKADACLLALGGPSWPKLGTDGAFLQPLRDIGLESRPYRPANCGFDVAWPADFVEQWAGTPIKSIRLTFEDQTVRGDFVITKHGIEGGPVYALSFLLRDEIEESGSAVLKVDLRPHLPRTDVVRLIRQPRGKQSLANHLRKLLRIQGPQAALLKACTEKEIMQDADALAGAIKALPIPLLRPRPLEEAISTAGGILVSQLDDKLMMRSKPGLFLAGEMLDWEAPTGGYLLTACLSQGYRAASGLSAYLS
ncbi:TIGR03862 family flavoprotein [uncultured Cohaesibacter sp.]|uniref:TIGR03862 family flavoprotein n=1 Tax=uncultured Cohaesibacter sp. TaxID=1002546 RepID=UPI00292F2EB7|nr:TIGR03862 family flavoprotein [uncultured Cohaesibacter sp.]